MEGFLPEPAHFSTQALHAGHTPEQWDSKCIVPPIVMSSTFLLTGAGNIHAEENKYLYGRYGNPTREVLETTLAALDEAKYALMFPSGLAALSAIASELRHTDHVISLNQLYGGSLKFMKELERRGCQVTYVGLNDVVNDIRKALKQNTKLVYMESLTNPTLQLVDVKSVAEVAHTLPEVKLVVDNTFLTPYFQRPLTLGADAVLYSCTKYINGHADIIMGAVTTSNEEMYQQLKYVQRDLGSVPSPFDCYLVHRGLKTLRIRMREHMVNGLKVAKFLEAHKLVEKVLNPGLPSHPQYELAKRVTSGNGGLVAFYIRNGTLEHSTKFVQNLKIFKLAASLGTDVSLVSIPTQLSHAMATEEERKLASITDNLIRLVVGLETAEDLIQDIDQALKHAMA